MAACDKNRNDNALHLIQLLLNMFYFRFWKPYLDKITWHYQRSSGGISHCSKLHKFRWLISIINLRGSKAYTAHRLCCQIPVLVWALGCDFHTPLDLVKFKHHYPLLKFGYFKKKIMILPDKFENHNFRLSILLFSTIPLIL